MSGYKLFYYLLNFTEKFPKLLRNIIQKFFLKKINRKILKLYFVPTNEKNLPASNYKNNESFEYQMNLIERFNQTKKQNSSMTCPHLIQLMLLIFDKKDKVSFLDFGGEKIDFFLNLQKNFENLEYFLFNLKPINEIFKKIKSQYNYKNLHIVENIKEIYEKDFEFVNFGSSIQYINNYENILNNLSTNNKFTFFSGTHLYDSDSEKFSKDLIVKQINILPYVNYLYFLNRKNFFKIFTDKKFKLVFEEKNLTDRIRYKNFRHFLNDVTYSDFLFKKN